MNAPLPADELDPYATHQAPQNVLMLAGLFTLPYRVLRTVVACGVNVHVLGGPGANGLRFSRFCAGFSGLSTSPEAADSADLINQINAIIAERGIDVVLAGDQPSTRLLILLAPSLDCPIFPGPTLEQFDLLNNKWEFTRLCQRLAILCPDLTLLPDKKALKNDLLRGTLPFPIVAKPLDLDGQRGVVPILSSSDLGKIDDIGYAPILVQSYIDGDDIGASIYAEDGVVKAFIAHRKSRATYRTFRHHQIEHDVAAIAASTGITGIYNFDMRMSPAGDVYWLECNPRFYFKMSLSMLAGLNFAEFGLHGSTPRAEIAYTPDGAKVRMLKALAAALPVPWRLSRRDLAYARHILADPIPFIRESLRVDWEDRSY